MPEILLHGILFHALLLYITMHYYEYYSMYYSTFLLLYMEYYSMRCIPFRASYIVIVSGFVLLLSIWNC